MWEFHANRVQNGTTPYSAAQRSICEAYEYLFKEWKRRSERRWEWVRAVLSELTQHKKWRSEWKLKIVNYIIKTDSCLFLTQTNLLLLPPLLVDATASVMLIIFVVCARFSVFRMQNIKSSLISHCNQMLCPARYEKCELKTTFYDETAHRAKYVYLYTKIVRYRLPHFALALSIVRQWTSHSYGTSIRSKSACFRFYFRKQQYHVRIAYDYSMLEWYLCARCMSVHRTYINFKRDDSVYNNKFSFSLNDTQIVQLNAIAICTSSTYPHAYMYYALICIAYDDLFFSYRKWVNLFQKNSWPAPIWKTQIKSRTKRRVTERGRERKEKTIKSISYWDRWVLRRFVQGIEFIVWHFNGERFIKVPGLEIFEREKPERKMWHNLIEQRESLTFQLQFQFFHFKYLIKIHWFEYSPGAPAHRTMPWLFILKWYSWHALRKD